MHPSHYIPVKPAEVTQLALELRERAGLSLREVARRIDCAPSSLSRAENGDERYASIAARAVDVLLEEEARESAQDTAPVISRYLVPDTLREAVGGLRAPERARKLALAQSVFAEFGLAVEQGDEPDLAVIERGGERVGRIDLDSLTTALEGKRHPRTLFPKSPEEEHLHRVAKRIADMK